MLELVEFHQSMKKGNKITLLPVFYKLTPDRLKSPKWTKAWVELFEEDEELVKKCEDAVHALKAINGLNFERYGKDHVKYTKDVVDEIRRLCPLPLLFDTSDMQGCDRLCKHISELFKERDGIHCLGIYGVHGSGKSKQCEAMCNYYSEEFAGKFCIVDLENDKATENRAKKEREGRLKTVIKKLFGSNQSTLHINSEEAQLQKYLKDRVQNERVFLVVENVSQSSMKEAKFYVEGGYAHGSRVLVTSRNRSILEKIFGGPKYSDFCQSVPVLNDIEAVQLFLAIGAPGKSITDLNDHEDGIVRDCCANSCFDAPLYHPSLLIARASYLERTVGGHEIANWNVETSIAWHDVFHDVFRHVLLEYDNNLSSSAKLVFTDLALLECNLTTYKDLCLGWKSPAYMLATHTISCLHGLSFEQAQTMVKELQDMSILIEAATGVAVPVFYRTFAHFLLHRADRDERKMYQLLHGHRACPPCIGIGWPEIETRLVMHDMTILRKDLQFQESTKLTYLELERVEKVKELNLDGLWFLRALIVKQCKDLKKIDSRCTSLGLSVETECEECVGNLRFVELNDLPNLKSLSFASHASRLETVWMSDCPKALGAWYLSSTCTSLKRLVLPTGYSGNMLIQKQLDKDLADGQLFMRLTELVLPRGGRPVVTDQKLAKYFLKNMMEAENLEVLDIGQTIPASIARMDSINVSKLVHLTILDLRRAKMRRIEGLCKLRHLGALGLYGCCELLELPDLDILPKLIRLCISHCYKLADPFSKEKLPHTLLGFHLGVRDYGHCKCLDPQRREKKEQNHGKG